MRLLRYLSFIGLKEFFERLETFQILEKLFDQTTLAAKYETYSSYNKSHKLSIFFQKHL